MVLVFSACCWYLSIHFDRCLVIAQIWKKFSQFSHKACLGGWWVSSRWAFSVVRSGQSTAQKWHLALSENKTTKGSDLATVDDVEELVSAIICLCCLGGRLSCTSCPPKNQWSLVPPPPPGPPGGTPAPAEGACIACT